MKPITTQRWIPFNFKGWPEDDLRYAALCLLMIFGVIAGRIGWFMFIGN